jgi:hypothetical protein
MSEARAKKRDSEVGTGAVLQEKVEDEGFGPRGN